MGLVGRLLINRRRCRDSSLGDRGLLDCRWRCRLASLGMLEAFVIFGSAAVVGGVACDRHGRPKGLGG
jgi:hypothetical protein